MLLTPHGLGIAVLKEDRFGQISAELTDGTSVQFGDKDFAQRVRRFAVLLQQRLERFEGGLRFVVLFGDV